MNGGPRRASRDRRRGRAVCAHWAFLRLRGGWIWAALGLPGADAFVGLFTTQLTDQSVGSIPALGIGSLCAFVVGGTFGVLIAPCYNLAGRVLGE